MKWLDRAFTAGLLIAFLIVAYGQRLEREKVDGLITANVSLIMALGQAAQQAKRSCGGRSL